MSLIKIYQAFGNEVATITPTITVVHQGIEFTPVNGVPYQEFHILPAGEKKPYINETNYKTYGIFQITLRYPNGEGIGKVLTRLEQYKELFVRKSKLTYDGLTVKLLSKAQTVNLGVDGDRVVFALSLEFEALI